MRIDQYLTHKQRFAKIKSKRLQQAVAKITGVDVNPELFLADIGQMPDEPLHLVPQSGSSVDEATKLVDGGLTGTGDVDAASGAQEEPLAGHGAGSQLVSAKKISTAKKTNQQPGLGTKRGSSRKNGHRPASDGPAGMEAASMGEDDDMGSAQSDLAFIRLMQGVE